MEADGRRALAQAVGVDAGADRGREHLEEAIVLVSCLKYLLSRWWKMGRKERSVIDSGTVLNKLIGE